MPKGGMGISGKMMLIDTSICMGCKACQVACKSWHQLPAEDTSFEGSYENPADLSGVTYTRVRFKEVLDAGPLKYMEWLFFKDQCRHCIGGRHGAPCQRACPLGAIVTEEGGAIVITDACDPDRCVTRPCEDACPYNIPRYNADENKEKKCDLCFSRIDGTDKVPAGAERDPVCVVTCPPGAITFGDASAIQNQANQRLAELRAEYPNAQVYPNGGMGGGGGGGHGTRVIWLLIDDPSAYGIPSGMGGMGGM